MITKFDKATLQSVRRDLNNVLAEYAKENGIEISIGNIRFSDGDFEAKINAKVIGTKTMHDKMLESIMNTHGLTENGLDGRLLIGYNSRSYKYPFIYEQNGKRFKCSVESASIYFKKNV